MYPLYGVAKVQLYPFPNQRNPHMTSRVADVRREKKKTSIGSSVRGVKNRKMKGGVHSRMIKIIKK